VRRLEKGPNARVVFGAHNMRHFAKICQNDLPIGCGLRYGGCHSVVKGPQDFDVMLDTHPSPPLM